MKLLAKTALAAAIVTLPLQVAANPSVWNSNAGPALPYRYIESTPIVRLIPQNENAAIYASDSLYLRLYPSINSAPTPADVTNEASIASKTREFGPIRTRGILSSSYVQEFAYIDTYSNNRRYEEFFNFPSIRMSLATPMFGNGLGGGYQPLQFGFNPAAFKFW
ncbi:MAG: hypothetical protein GQ535_07650 [Rhodobacteraceae bacterium]|nr:hypothetical protein [Paracoccaceae bacterium]